MQDNAEGTVKGVDMGYLAAPLLRLLDSTGRPVPNVPEESVVYAFQVGRLDMQVVRASGLVGLEKHSRPGNQRL
jgi:hypothetical protein